MGYSPDCSAKLVGESGFRKPHYDDLEHLRSHFFEFFDTYNFATIEIAQRKYTISIYMQMLAIRSVCV